MQAQRSANKSPFTGPPRRNSKMLSVREKIGGPFAPATPGMRPPDHARLERGGEHPEHTTSILESQMNSLQSARSGRARCSVRPIQRSRGADIQVPDARTDSRQARPSPVGIGFATAIHTRAAWHGTRPLSVAWWQTNHLIAIATRTDRPGPPSQRRTRWPQPRGQFRMSGRSSQGHPLSWSGARMFGW